MCCLHTEGGEGRGGGVSLHTAILSVSLARYGNRAGSGPHVTRRSFKMAGGAFYQAKNWLKTLIFTVFRLVNEG
jgi:hypothetical protein